MKKIGYTKEEERFLQAKGQVITQLRKDAGFSNGKDFAKHIDMAPSLYMRHEKGENAKTITLKRLLSHHKINLRQYYTSVYKVLDQNNKPLQIQPSTINHQPATPLTSNL